MSDFYLGRDDPSDTPQFGLQPYLMGGGIDDMADQFAVSGEPFLAPDTISPLEMDETYERYQGDEYETNEEPIKYEEQGEDSVPLYCHCRRPEGGFMIFCESCQEWFHGKCVGIERELGEKLPRYVCHICRGATIEENLEILVSESVGKKKSRSIPKSRSKGANSPDEVEVEEQKSPRKPQIAIKKSAATLKQSKTFESNSGSSSRQSLSSSSVKSKPSDIPNKSTAPISSKDKKRPLEGEKSLPPAKRSKLSHDVSKTTDGPRISFRTSLLDVIKSVVSDSGYQSAIKEVFDASKTETVKIPNNDEIVSLTTKIETSCYEKCLRKTDSNYNDLLRSLRFALRHNPALIVKMTNSLLDPSKLAHMTTEELAPEKDKAAMREVIMEDDLLRNKAAAEAAEEAHLNSLLANAKSDISGSKEAGVIVHALPSYYEELKSLTQINEDQKQENENNLINKNDDSQPQSIKDLPGGLLKKPKKETSVGLSAAEMMLLKNSGIKTNLELDESSFDVDQLKLSTSSNIIAPETESITKESTESVEKEKINNEGAKAILEAIETKIGISNILSEISFESMGMESMENVKPNEDSDEEKEQRKDEQQQQDGQQRDQHDQLHDQQRDQDDHEDTTIPDFDSSVHKDKKAQKPSSDKPYPNVWKGSLSYRGACPDVDVVLRRVTGPPIDKLFHEFGVPSFELQHRVDLAKILDYIPQIDGSSSRSRSTFYFEPSPIHSKAAENYKSLFEYLHSIGRSGVGVIKAGLAEHGVFKEIYVFPIKADGSAPAFLPKDLADDNVDRLYLSVISDKKLVEKLLSSKKSSSSKHQLGPTSSRSSTSKPASAPTSLPPPHSNLSGTIGNVLSGINLGALGGLPPTNPVVPPPSYLPPPQQQQQHRGPPMGQHGIPPGRPNIPPPFGPPPPGFGFPPRGPPPGPQHMQPPPQFMHHPPPMQRPYGGYEPPRGVDPYFRGPPPAAGPGPWNAPPAAAMPASAPSSSAPPTHHPSYIPLASQPQPSSQPQPPSQPQHSSNTQLDLGDVDIGSLLEAVSKQHTNVPK